MISPNIFGLHFLECLPLAGQGQLGHRHQSTDGKRLDDDRRGQRGEVFLSFLGKIQQGEQLRDTRLTKSFIASDLNFGEAGFVVQSLLPIEHRANRVAHRGVAAASFTVACRARGERLPRELERLRHKGSEAVLWQWHPDHQLDSETGSQLAHAPSATFRETNDSVHFPLARFPEPPEFLPVSRSL